MHVMSSISEREWLNSYFNKREEKTNEKKQRKPKSKQNLKQIAHRIKLDSHKSTGNKIIRQTCCVSVKRRRTRRSPAHCNSISSTAVGEVYFGRIIRGGNK